MFCSDSNLTSISHYGRQLYEIECNGSVDFFDPTEEKVKMLIDGRLYVDNRKVVDIYDDGFCVENFVDELENFSAISAFVFFPLVPSLNLTSNTKLVKLNLIIILNIFTFFILLVQICREG